MELEDDVLLRVQGLQTQFTTSDGPVRAVDGVDLEVRRGRTVCVVGESGCGKSVTARSVLGLVEAPGEVIGGQAWWRGSVSDSDAIDLLRLDPRGERLRRVRGGEIAMVFQEPMASLSPMYTVADHLVEAIRLHTDCTAAAARDRAVELLRTVGIPRPVDRLDAYPFELSGGMCQRVMIAIALCCNPALLIADEPTTALDVTTQARILDLLADLKDERDMAMLFITHDLGVVAEIADDVVVMYLGTVVETGSVEDIFDRPQHPYTRALLESIPKMSAAGRSRMQAIRGNVPHPSERPDGCPFHPRCDVAVAGVCDIQEPPTRATASGRARCIHAGGTAGTPVALGASPAEAGDRA